MPISLGGFGPEGFPTLGFVQGSNNPATFNSAGSASNLFDQVLQAGQLGLNIFREVSGRNVPPTALVPTNPSPASSIVPVPAAITRINTSQFSPQSNLMMRLPPGLAATASSTVRSGVAGILRKIKANTGLRITTKKIVSAIREFGPAAVASWAGVSMEEMMVIWDRGSRRVKRRFTKRDRARGRSYIRMLARNVQELKDMGCGPATRKRRKY